MTFKDYLPYYRRNLRVAFPVMLTQLGAALVGLFDSIMVGHYATTDLAAVSFANAIFFTFMVFAMGVLMGVTPLVGNEVGRMQEGEDRREHISALLQNGIWVTLMLSVVMVAILGTAVALLDDMGQDPAVAETARPYFTLIVLSIVPFLFFCLQKQFLEGLGNTMVAMLITLVMNALNIFLNWVLIFGHFGFQPMGATGAGIATLVSRLLLPLCFTAVMLFRRDWRGYIAGMAGRLNNWMDIRRLLAVGVPIGGQTVLEAFIFTASFVVVGWLSKEALAAHQVANQMADLTFMLASGIGAATTIRISIQMGRRDLHAAKMAAKASIHLCLLMNTIGAALMISCRHVIPYIFTDDEAVVGIASGLVLCAGLLQYADGMQCVGAAMLRGITDVKRPMVHAFVSYIVISMPVGLFCAFVLKLGAVGIWIGFIVGLTIAAVLFHTRFRKKMHELEEKFAHVEKM